MNRREFVSYGGGFVSSSLLFTSPSTASVPLIAWSVLRSAATLITLWQGAKMLKEEYDNNYKGSKIDEEMENALKSQDFEPKQHYRIETKKGSGHAILGQKPHKPIANCLVINTSNQLIMIEGGALMTLHDIWRIFESSGLPKSKISDFTKPSGPINNTLQGDICTGYGRNFSYQTKGGSVEMGWTLRKYKEKIWGKGDYIVQNHDLNDIYRGNSSAYILNSC